MVTRVPSTRRLPGPAPGDVRACTAFAPPPEIRLDVDFKPPVSTPTCPEALEEFTRAVRGLGTARLGTLGLGTAGLGTSGTDLGVDTLAPASSALPEGEIFNAWLERDEVSADPLELVAAAAAAAGGPSPLLLAAAASHAEALSAGGERPGLSAEAAVTMRPCCFCHWLTTLLTREFAVHTLT